MSGSKRARRRRRLTRLKNRCGCWYCDGNKRPFLNDSRCTRERRALADARE